MNEYSSNDRLLSVVCDTLGVHSALLFLPDEDGAYVAAAACTAKPSPIQASIAPGRGLVGWILRNRQPLILNSFDARLSTLGYYEYEMEESITAFMGVPLTNGGVLCVDATADDRNFSTRDQQLLQRFASLVEDQSEKLDEEQNNASIRRYFETIEKIQALREESLPWRGYLQQMLKLLLESTDYDYAALAMRPEDAQFFVIEAESEPFLLAEDAPETFPLGSGLVGWVFTEELPIFADGIETGAGPLFGKLPQDPMFKRAICLPVVHSRTVCGALILASQEAQPIPDGLRSFATMAARELGSYLETLYLRHRVQSMLPRAQMYFNNAPHDPDEANETDEEQEM